jgi:23S rRNA (cytosine1962-C5)-methyltransferase
MRDGTLVSNADARALMFPSAKILAAIDKRHGIDRKKTNALRLVDGPGDGLPNLIIDDFAGRWLAQTFSETEPLLQADLGYDSLYWKSLVKGANATSGYLAGEPIRKPFAILESGLEFEVDFQAGTSPGVFLDQRLNRQKLRSIARGKKILNTFSYTCAFGVAAAAGGASTTNVDLSRRYLDWGKRNYQLNRIGAENHEFLAGDVFDWLKRFRKQERKFDAIVLDPPTFSRDRRSKVFRVQDDYGRLVGLASECLDREGLLLCCTNFRGLTSGEFLRILRLAISRPCKTSHGPMPPDFTGEHYLKSVWLQL